MLTKLALSVIAPAAALLLVGCSKPALTIQYYPLLQASFPMVQPGQTIKFRNPTGKGFKPIFKAPPPCTKRSDLDNGVCVVDLKARHALYPYTCEDCGDPDIMVGSDLQIDKLHGTRSSTPPALVEFACYSDQPTRFVRGDPVTVSAASPGSIVWQLAGNATDPNWTVDDFRDDSIPGDPTAKICNSSNFDQDIPKCTLDPSNLAAGHNYSYQVAARGCTGPTRGLIKAQ